MAGRGPGAEAGTPAAVGGAARIATTSARRAPCPTPEPARKAAIIVNPTKFDDVAAVRAQITKQSINHGWAEPLFILTTANATRAPDRPARPLDKGVDMVCPLGGDGTVRAVAEAMVGSETPMGLLPGGTGNLLARNLDLPVDDLDDALRIALTGQNKRVDVGRLTMDTSGEDDRPAEPRLPRHGRPRLRRGDHGRRPREAQGQGGPGGIHRLGHPQPARSAVQGPDQVDDQEEFSRRARTVVIGNCGKLTGGLVLMPEAELDDGQLDCVILSPKRPVGWIAVAARLLSQRRKGHQSVDHQRAASLTIRADRPQEVQIDGDTIGEAKALRAVVRPLALVVRVG